jgi:hypothetical protein
MSTIVNGVEYDQTSIPSNLWRATKYAYAMDLMENGVLYLSNARKYRNDPDPERGDPTETDGRFIRQEVMCTTSHINPIFLSCATLNPDPESVLAVWRDCDTVIHISNPQALAERMLNTAKAQGVDVVSFHAGTPTYDKDKGGSAAYHWTESIFQKPDGQASQKEYRFALVGSYAMTGTPSVKLTMGRCADIISIAKTREC